MFENLHVSRASLLGLEHGYRSFNNIRPKRDVVVEHHGGFPTAPGEIHDQSLPRRV